MMVWDSEAVRKALDDALTENGSDSTSARDVAERLGVNVMDDEECTRFLKQLERLHVRRQIHFEGAIGREGGVVMRPM